MAEINTNDQIDLINSQIINESQECNNENQNTDEITDPANKTNSTIDEQLDENEGEMIKKTLTLLTKCTEIKKINEEIRILYNTTGVAKKGAQIMNLLDEQERKNNEIILEVTIITKTLQEQKKSQENNLVETIAVEETQPPRNVEQGNLHILNNNMNNIDHIKEGINREKNKSNTIIYGLKENENFEEVIEQICTKIGVAQPWKSFRIGKEIQSKHRPIKMMFKTKDNNNMFFKTYLKQKEIQKLTYYIKNDLTKNQQMQRRELIQNSQTDSNGDQLTVRKKIVLRNGIFRFSDDLKGTFRQRRDIQCPSCT